MCFVSLLQALYEVMSKKWTSHSWRLFPLLFLLFGFTDKDSKELFVYVGYWQLLFPSLEIKICMMFQ